VLYRIIKTLLKTLDEVSNGNDEYTAKAKGVIMKMESFDIFNGLKLSNFIFSASEIFFVTFKPKI